MKCIPSLHFLDNRIFPMSTAGRVFQHENPVSCYTCVIGPARVRIAFLVVRICRDRFGDLDSIGFNLLHESVDAFDFDRESIEDRALVR